MEESEDGYEDGKRENGGLRPLLGDDEHESDSGMGKKIIKGEEVRVN